MRKCLKFDPKERPDFASLVDYLGAAADGSDDGSDGGDRVNIAKGVAN